MPEPTVLESLLMAVTHVSTLLEENQLTNATGFFFERDGRLFLITSRYVVLDENTQHGPDRLAIELHTDPNDLTVVNSVTLPLHRDGQALWRQAVDSAGLVDVAVLEILRRELPEHAMLRAFTPDHIATDFRQIEVGTAVLIVGFPLRFHDNVHHLPVARRAVIASAFGICFQRQGCFLTDALLHRGISGGPAVARTTDSKTRDLPWILLGVHASRMDVTNRDAAQDERLNLNCAGYADVIFTLTEDSPARQPANTDH